MDIVIRNGVIDKSEGKRIREIKNEAGLLKKDFSNYINGVPGPYYDLFNNHLCIPRRPHIIKNFFGPQDTKKIKLLENTDKISKNDKYCVICHKLMKPNTAFSARKRILIEENIYEKKIHESNILYESIKKMKIEDKSENKIEVNIKENLEKWKDLYDKLYKLNITKNLHNEKEKHKRVIKRFSILCNKLITEPIHYEISHFETKLIYPTELTPYQKFKLNNPDYKNSPMFCHRRNYRITNNYVTIE